MLPTIDGASVTDLDVVIGELCRMRREGPLACREAWTARIDRALEERTRLSAS